MLSALEPPFSLEGMSFVVHASVGVAIAPVHGSNGSDLMRHADTAMYRAKRLGGATFSIHSPADDARAAGRLQLLTELETAIATEQLTLVYQPVVDLSSRRVTGVEALARWPDPRRGLILPQVFVPLAEETGLIRRLTRHVFKLAVQQLRQWQAQGLEIGVAVNLSAHDLRDNDLVTTFMHELDLCGVRPSLLKIEVTESALMDDPQRVQLILGQFRENGIQIGIDDFGSGYSSLAYLRQFPADVLKIDIAFVSDITTAPRDLAVVHTMIELGHHLGMRVLAEGVENEETLDLLAAHGCDLVQGYFVGRPMPPDELVAHIGRDGFGPR